MIKAHIKDTVAKLPTLANKEKTKGKTEDAAQILMGGAPIESLEKLRAALTTLKELQTELRPMIYIDNKIQFLKDFKSSELFSSLKK